MERAETLNGYLSSLRLGSGLSVEVVCQRTKIQARFVEALEAGRWGEVPSNTHVRAFSVAIAKACGADGTRAEALALRTLAVTAPVFLGGQERGFDTPAPAPALAKEFEPVAGDAAVPARSGVGLGHPGGAPNGAAPRDSSLIAASARLRALPIGVLLSFLAVAGALSYGAAWSVERWHQHEITSILSGRPGVQAVPVSETEGASVQDLGGPAGQIPPKALGANAAAKSGVSGPTVLTTSASLPGVVPLEAPTLQLVLRARRPCWLVLNIDGKRLPTVTMLDGDKLRWNVSQRAVLLAGNVGALRVWWQGDNLGYLGPLDQRANALVFERGHEPRKDSSAALALPSGIE